MVPGHGLIRLAAAPWGTQPPGRLPPLPGAGHNWQPGLYSFPVRSVRRKAGPALQTALRRRPPLHSTPISRATASVEEESERKVLVASRASVRGANIYRGTTPPLLMGGHRDEVESWFRIH